jgi:hypothetical protein
MFVCGYITRYSNSLAVSLIHTGINETSAGGKTYVLFTVTILTPETKKVYTFFKNSLYLNRTRNALY